MVDPQSQTERAPTFGERFEAMSQEGGAYWFARDLVPLLGYREWRELKEIVHQAIAKNTLDRTPPDFLSITRMVEGAATDDFQLSRFGCCMVALNGDREIPEIAAAQEYFVAEIRYEIEDFIEYRE